MSFNIGDFLAGWTGGVLSLLVSHPFDTVKVRQQTYNSNFITAVKDTYKYQGFKGFYKGIISPLLAYGPSNSLFFGFYGNCLRLMEHSSVLKHHISPTDSGAIYRVFVSGTVAGLFQTIFYAPVEYVKLLLQANTEAKGHLKKKYVPPYKTTLEAVVGIYKSSGFLGYYRGFFPMFIRDSPSGGVYMLVYEMLRHDTFEHLNNIGHIGKEVIAGGTAGLISIVTVIPFDVVKTQIQTDDPKNPYYTGTLDCFRKLYTNDGISIFFKGLPIICMRAFPAHAVMFVGYEFVMRYIE